MKHPGTPGKDNTKPKKIKHPVTSGEMQQKSNKHQASR